jgi:hypothetical protein
LGFALGDFCLYLLAYGTAAGIANQELRHDHYVTGWQSWFSLPKIDFFVFLTTLSKPTPIFLLRLTTLSRL